MATQDTQGKRRIEALGAQIARLRQRAGMSKQADLQRAAGVGIRTISLIETGQKVPRVSTMRKIEAALQLAPGATDDYLEGTITQLEPETAETSAIHRRVVDESDAWEVQMMNLDALPEEQRWEAIFEHRKQQQSTDSPQRFGQTG